MSAPPIHFSVRLVQSMVHNAHTVSLESVSGSACPKTMPFYKTLFTLLLKPETRARFYIL